MRALGSCIKHQLSHCSPSFCNFRWKRTQCFTKVFNLTAPGHDFHHHQPSPTGHAGRLETCRHRLYYNINGLNPPLLESGVKLPPRLSEGRENFKQNSFPFQSVSLALHIFCMCGCCETSTFQQEKEGRH